LVLFGGTIVLFCMIEYTYRKNMRLLIKSELNLLIRRAVNGSTKNRNKKPNQLVRTECID
jgi:hypothetical protein